MGPYPGDQTRKSDLALGFVQGKIFLICETPPEVLRDGGSAMKVIRPPGLDRL